MNIPGALSIIIGLYALMGGCNRQRDYAREPVSGSYTQRDSVIVTTERVLMTGFSTEVISNGKLAASRKAGIPFLVPGMVSAVEVRNGQRVIHGEIMAQIDPYEYKLAYARAKDAFDGASLEMESLLLGFGYRKSDSARIPPPQWQMASTQSGYFRAQISLDEARFKLAHTVIRAPFSGIIADLEAKPNNPTASYTRLCNLIDERSLMAEFPILEYETVKIQPGQSVNIIPFNGTKPVRGSVCAINPRVEDNGLVSVTACIQEHLPELMDGMNVKVVVQNTIPACLSVPKTAVVLRQGRAVVFTYDNGRAFWNYVETGEENSRRVRVLSGLKPGMEVIISGNLNLAHGTPVVLKTESGQ